MLHNFNDILQHRFSPLFFTLKLLEYRWCLFLIPTILATFSREKENAISQLRREEISDYHETAITRATFIDKITSCCCVYIAPVLIQQCEIWIPYRMFAWSVLRILFRFSKEDFPHYPPKHSRESSTLLAGVTPSESRLFYLVVVIWVHSRKMEMNSLDRYINIPFGSDSKWGWRMIRDQDSHDQPGCT